MNVKLKTLPCPNCTRPNPIEARFCACGYVLVKRSIAQPAKAFAERQSFVEELKREMAAADLEAARNEIIFEERSTSKPEKRAEKAKPTVAPPVRTTSTAGSGAATAAAMKATPAEEAVGQAVQKENAQKAETTRPAVDAVPTNEAGLEFLNEIIASPEPARRRWVVPAAAVAVLVAIAVAGSGYLGSAEGLPFFGGATTADEPSAVNFAGTTETTPAVSNEPAAESSAAPADGSNESAVAQPETKAVAIDSLAARENSRALSAETRNVSEPAGPAPLTQPANAVNAAGNEAAPAETSSKAAARPTPIAMCGDGTYSYRSSRGEICAQRGGVARWMDGSGPKPAKQAAQKETAPARAYILGPRGGCYFLDASGKKNYVDKSLCSE